jgi:hypothetical protein
MKTDDFTEGQDPEQIDDWYDRFADGIEFFDEGKLVKDKIRFIDDKLNR